MKAPYVQCCGHLPFKCSIHSCRGLKLQPHSLTSHQLMVFGQIHTQATLPNKEPSFTACLQALKPHKFLVLLCISKPFFLFPRYVQHLKQFLVTTSTQMRVDWYMALQFCIVAKTQMLCGWMQDTLLLKGTKHQLSVFVKMPVACMFFHVCFTFEFRLRTVYRRNV